MKQWNYNLNYLLIIALFAGPEYESSTVAFKTVILS